MPASRRSASQRVRAGPAGAEPDLGLYQTVLNKQLLNTRALNFSCLLILRDGLLRGRGPSSPDSAGEALGVAGCVRAEAVLSVPSVHCLPEEGLCGAGSRCPGWEVACSPVVPDSAEIRVPLEELFNHTEPGARLDCLLEAGGWCPAAHLPSLNALLCCNTSCALWPGSPHRGRMILQP